MPFKSFSVRMMITVVLILLSTFVNFGTPCCEQKEQISTLLLNTAMNLISIANSKNISCPVEHNITKATPQDCTDLYRRGYNKSGVYAIWPVNRLTWMKSIDVYCDMNDGGWTVIQRRGDFGRENDYFNQHWNSYKKGFGDLEKDFWLGNDYIFALTNQRQYSVYFALEDRQHKKYYAHYDNFWIDDGANKYTLHISGNRGGSAGEYIMHYSNEKFSTNDQDNTKSKKDCAKIYKGGWWFLGCDTSNLNGVYNNATRGIHWGSIVNLLRAEIKIKPYIY